MRKLASLGMSLAIACVYVAMTAGPASAAHHHHHHHHHHSGGSGPTCGPGTVNVGGVCTPTGPSGPVGNSNVVITPSSVTMNLDGSFALSAVISGLPPLMPSLAFSLASLAAGCPGGVLSLSPLPVPTDALGRAQVVVSESGHCVPGTYPFIFSENSSPFQSFTGFITLHF